MDEQDWLADRFEERRAHLRAVAYRMLGSLAEADDAVQDTWLRVSRSGAGNVENLGAWLTTIVARVCLNILRSRNTWREEELGPHLPDPEVRSPEDEALPGAGSRARRSRLPMPTSPGSARSSTRSSRRPAAATSTRWSRCSTRTSCCDRTPAAGAPASRR